MRDLRVLNFSAGQKIESDDVMKRIGELEHRNSGTISKMALFDSGKALIVGTGLRVEPSSGMTVNVPSGSVFQRLINTGNVLPCQQITDQTVTMDAATGTPRTDIIEAQVYTAEDKTDTVQEATVLSSGGESQVTITNESVERDIRYYLRVQKSTGTTTPTGGTPGELTGTADLSGTVDLSTVYLINLRDGEDGDFQEIDCRGATPAATTRSEIITAINTAVGRTMATASGDYLKLTGESLGEASTFSLKPPNTDSDLDAINAIFGLSLGNYKLVYSGTNEWFKLAELDIGASTTTITSGLIRNIDEKDTWTGESEHTLVETPVFELIDDIIDGTQQLSNTKLNEAVALTATSSELNLSLNDFIYRSACINSDMSEAQISAPNLSNSWQWGAVDCFGAVATGTVGAGTIAQTTSPNVTTDSGKAMHLSGVTLSAGSEEVYIAYLMTADDAVKYANLAASTGLNIYHDVGSTLSGTIHIYKETATADAFSTLSSIATTAISLTTGVNNAVEFPNINSGDLGDVSKGLVIIIEIVTGAITTKNFEFANFQFNKGASVLSHVTRLDSKYKCLERYELSALHPMWCGDVTSASIYYLYVPYSTIKRVSVAPTVADITSSKFPSTAPIIDNQNINGFQVHKVANATGPAGYYQFSYVCDARPDITNLPTP